MRSVAKNNLKDWARMAVKLGLLLTEPKTRNEIAEKLKDRADYFSDTIAGKYEDAADRLEAAGAALQGRRDWVSPVMGLVVGIAVGTGLGILLAPAAGSETREAIRGKVVDVKNRAVDSAHAAAGKFRQSVASMPSTGTEG